MQQNMRRLGKINCLEINNSDDAPWVVLFHGYGADAPDLFSLGEMISTNKTLNWLFPQGPLEVPIGPGWTGRAWWNIDMQSIMDAQAKGTTRDMADVIPDKFPQLRAQIDEMIKQLRTPKNQIILGGFSQGAMLATDLFLRSEENFAGLCLLSGTLINQTEWKSFAEKKSGQTFFQSHGTSDTVLGFKQAQKLETLLTQAGMKGSLQPFSGGHEIPMEVLRKMTAYLNGLHLEK